MNKSPAISTLLACVPIALCLWTGPANAVDLRSFAQQANINGLTTDGQFFALTLSRVIQKTDNVVTADVRSVFIFVNNQGFFADNLSGAAYSFDISKGTASVNTLVPGCPGGAVVDIAATSTVIEVKTRTVIKGDATGKQKFLLQNTNREARNVTGTLCGRRIETIFNGFMTEDENRSVTP